MLLLKSLVSGWSMHPHEQYTYKLTAHFCPTLCPVLKLIFNKTHCKPQTKEAPLNHCEKYFPLQKHAHVKYRFFLKVVKIENFQQKMFDIFLKQKKKICFVVCDNGFSQIFYNCSNVEEIFSRHN